MNQKLAVWILKKSGHSVTVASTGQEALDALAKGQFDVVLMDVQMPEMNGFEATKIIRQNERTTGKRLPIIAMTALAMKGDRERCLAAGMDEYIAKPIHADQIYQAVGQILKVDPEEFTTHRNTAVAVTSSTEVDPIFNEGELLTRVEASRELIEELILTFLEEYPPLLIEITNAVGRSDAEVVHHLSHRIKGSAAIFGATAVVQTAQRLEDMGRVDDLRGAVEALADLNRELDRLREALSEAALQTV